MHKPLVFIIEWFGPYSSIIEANKAAKDFGDGFYLCTGLRSKERLTPKIQYVGISKRLSNRVRNDHHKLALITKKFKLWLGEVSTQQPTGRNRQKTKISLNYVEWALTHSLNPKLNDKKISNPPKRSVTILNRWWKRNYEARFRKRPHPDWPDLVDYIIEDSINEGKAVWFGIRGKVKHIDF